MKYFRLSARHRSKFSVLWCSFFTYNFCAL